MHQGYIIISEKLQSYAKLLGRAILCSLRNMACLAVYSQILRKQYNIFSRQFVTGMCAAMTREKASFRSANQGSAKIN
jgi:hypothetical protein